eukprot:540971-Lingulodinium_polyedra.AAC.1
MRKRLNFSDRPAAKQNSKSLQPALSNAYANNARSFPPSSGPPGRPPPTNNRSREFRPAPW